MSNAPISSSSIANSPIKNAMMAVAMMSFLALSFKLSSDLTTDTQPSISPTDAVISTLNQPNQQTALSTHN
nr:hypothetical protein [Moraxella sp. CTOTU46934]